MKKASYIVACLLLALLFSCYKKPDDTFRLYKKWFLDFESDTIPLRSDVNPFEGKYCAYLPKNTQFGPGINYIIPDSLYYSYIKIVVDFDARIGGRRFGQALCVTVQNGPTPHYWYSFDIAPKNFFKEKWFHVQDSLQFVITEAMKGAQIRIFPFNPYRKSTLAIDNLEVKLIKVN